MLSTGSPLLAKLEEPNHVIMVARTLRDAVHGKQPLYPRFAMAAEDAAKLAALLFILLILFDLTPGRVRLGFGAARHAVFRRVRRGHVWVLVILFGLSLTPLTCIQRADAYDGGGGGSPPAPVFPVYFVHTDHLGSTTMLTCYKQPSWTNCADGAVAQYYRYDPYGEFFTYDGAGNFAYNVFAATQHLYTGQRWDLNTGLYYYHARYYDPRIAQFVTTDPVREYMNPYAYVMWNPLKFTDPTGMFSELTFNMILDRFGAEFAMRYASMTGGVAERRWDWCWRFRRQRRRRVRR